MIHRFRYLILVPFTALLLLLGGSASASAAPANDNFASAQTLNGALPITASGSSVGATAEPGEPDIYMNSVSRSVWYKWTATASGTVVLDQCNDGFTGGNRDPMMAVRTGLSLGTQNLVAEIAGRCSLRFFVLIGTTYNIQVDYSDEGNFNLKLRALAPPANDYFGAATVLGPALPISKAGTTVDSTWEAGEPASLGGSTNSRSVWYSWTAPSTGRVRLSLCEKTFVDGAANDATIVYTGSTLATLMPIVQVSSNDCNVDFPVAAGTTYKIAVSGYIQGDFGFVLDLKAAPTPANDDFASAQTIGPNLPITTSGNNDFATEEAGEPNHGGYPDTSRSVWYSWTAAISGPVRLKTCNPGLELFTSVYTGNTLASLTEVGRREYYAPCSNFFDAVAGTTYKIAVAGAPFSSTHGPFTLGLRTVSIPGNDNFASAINLGSDLAISRDGTTVDATTEDNEPNHANGYGGDYGGSVWYRWTSPTDAAVILQACSSDEPNLIAVYREDPELEGPAPQNLTQLDNDARDCGNGTKGGRLAIAAVKGTTYYVAVAAAEADYESPFTLKISGPADTSGPGIQPKPGFNLKKAIAKCRKIKNKKKRTRCIKTAKKKAALIKCKKIKNGKARVKCEKKARKRFATKR